MEKCIRIESQPVKQSGDHHDFVAFFCLSDIIVWANLIIETHLNL